MKKNKGLTLIEILVVMTIVIILAMMMVGIFNSINITNKGRDAQRKKDLNRIKIAFEEYFNDKESYPQDVDTWNIKSNCNSGTIFAPYLIPWPCDPNGEVYKILIDVNKFRVITNLENKKDKYIPDGWYEKTNLNLVGLTVNDVNYGVSSTNILWYDMIIDLDCDTSICLGNAKSGIGCQHRDFSIGCVGDGCYFWDTTNGGSCTEKCKTSCCGAGCVPN